MKATSWTTLKDYHEVKGIQNKLPYHRIRISKLLKEQEADREIEINGEKTEVWEYKGMLVRRAGGSILVIDL